MIPILNRGAGDAALAGLGLDRQGGEPLYRQLTAQLRAMVDSGRLPAGARVPASRALADALGISRTTALQAFEQLAAEGYLEARQGAGTFVAAVTTAQPSTLPDTSPAPASPKSPQRAIAADDSTALPFRPGIPDPLQFPAMLWSRLLQRAWRAPDPALLIEPNWAGLPALRQAIAGHLRTFRGLPCTAGNVLVTAGVRDALALIGQALLPARAPVAIEEPGFPPLRGALAAQDRPVLPCPVGPDGLVVSALATCAATACAVTVTPSRHYPLGATLPLARRIALLDWAAERDAWIVEDDYDSEFRYAGQPIPPLAALDRRGRVLYLGSFSKVMFPTLRLGYVIAPEAVVETLAAARLRHSDPPSMVSQPALAAFIEDGGFARHLRRMRRLYQHRQAAFLTAFDRHLSPWLAVEPAPAGMHLVARRGPALPDAIDDAGLSARAARDGLHVPPLSACYSTPPLDQDEAGSGGRFGLLFGYAGIDEAAMTAALVRFAACLVDHCQTPRGR